MTIALSQRLNAEALLRVRASHRSHPTWKTGNDSPYLSPAQGFPGMLQFNGAALAIPMLVGKKAWEAREAYLDDVAHLVRVQGVLDVKDGKSLNESIFQSAGNDYLLWHHQISLAASWLKHASALICTNAAEAEGNRGQNAIA